VENMEGVQAAGVQDLNTSNSDSGEKKKILVINVIGRANRTRSRLSPIKSRRSSLSTIPLGKNMTNLRSRGFEGIFWGSHMPRFRIITGTRPPSGTLACLEPGSLLPSKP
jgi:hypothetical protein